MGRINQIKIPVDFADSKLIKLTKLSELEDAYHPNNIEEGFSIEGRFIHKPIVGNSFYLAVENAVAGMIVHSAFRTSMVKEILDDNTFKTMNSVYSWVEVEE